MAAHALRRTLLSLGLAGGLAVTAAVDPASAAPTGGTGAWSGAIDWSSVQIANIKLKGFVAVHLAVGPAGDVLMWDREDGLTSAKRWDPNTGAFTDAANAALPTSLFCAFQTRLPGGKLIVVGGTALKKGAGGWSWPGPASTSPASTTGRPTTGRRPRRCTRPAGTPPWSPCPTAARSSWAARS